jgi:PKD domain
MPHRRRLGFFVVIALAGMSAATAQATPPATNPIVTSQATPTAASDVQTNPAVVSNPNGTGGGLERLVFATNATPVTTSLGLWRELTPNCNTNQCWTALPNGSWPNWKQLSGGAVPANPNGVVPALPAAAWGANDQVFVGWMGSSASWLGTAAYDNHACSNSAQIYVSSTQNASATTPSWAATTHVPTTAQTALSWPSVAYSSDFQAPVLAAEYTPCPPSQNPELLRMYFSSQPITNPTAFDLPAYVDTYGYEPDVVEVPGQQNPTVAVAYLSAPPGGPDRIKVTLCTFSNGVWGCPVGVDVSGPITALGGTLDLGGASVPALTAPRIAVAPDGTLRVVWAAPTSPSATDSRVFIAQSTDASGQNWQAPGQVTSNGAHQWLASVAVGPNSRADVAYLDTRDGVHGQYRPYATSISSTGTRGQDVPLAGVTPPATVADPIGERSAALSPFSSIPSVIRYLGHAAAFFASTGGTSGATASIYESEVWHGLSPPTLPTQPNGPRSVAKNTSVNIADWFRPTALDGDPITVTVSQPPANGSIDVTNVYHPQTSYAGPDAVQITANDTYNAATSQTYAITVTNQRPDIAPVTPIVLDEGGATATINLNATDPDVNDPVTLHLINAPSQLHVSLTGTTLSVSDPNGVRSATPLTITVQARDTTTPVANTGISDLPIAISIRPSLAPVLLAAPALHTEGFYAQLVATPRWNDADANRCLASGQCHYQLDWSFGDGASQRTTSPASGATAVSHVYRRAGRYEATVTAQIVGYPNATPSAAAAGIQVAITNDIRTQLFVVTSARRHQLVVTIRSRQTASLSVQLIGAGLSQTRTIAVRAGRSGGLGRPLKLALSTRGARGRAAMLIVGFAGGLADQPTPLPLRRLIWIS